MTITNQLRLIRPGQSFGFTFVFKNLTLTADHTVSMLLYTSKLVKVLHGREDGSGDFDVIRQGDPDDTSSVMFNITHEQCVALGQGPLTLEVYVYNAATSEALQGKFVVADITNEKPRRHGCCCNPCTNGCKHRDDVLKADIGLFTRLVLGIPGPQGEPGKDAVLPDNLVEYEDDGTTIRAKGNIILLNGKGIAADGVTEVTRADGTSVRTSNHIILMRKAYFDAQGNFLYEGVDVGNVEDYFNINSYEMPMVEYPNNNKPTLEAYLAQVASEANKDILVPYRLLAPLVGNKEYPGDISYSSTEQKTISFSIDDLQVSIRRKNQTEVDVLLTSVQNIQLSVTHRYSGNNTSESLRELFNITPTGSAIATITVGQYIMAEFIVKYKGVRYTLTAGSDDDALSQAWVIVSTARP